MASQNDYQQSRYQIKLKIDNIQNPETIKNVFSTNIFIPMIPNLTDK